MANKKGINPVTAGVVGAAVGVAVGVAAAELTDPKKRKAVGDEISKLTAVAKEKGAEAIDELKEKAEEVKAQ